MQQQQRKYSPKLFVAYILFMLMTSLWPMQETSPGASVTLRIDPGLQNFMHFPLLAIFAWLFWDFLQQVALTAQLKYAIFFGLGAPFCILLESLQIFVPGRFFSLSDIMANLLGLFLGFGLYRIRQYRQT